MLYSRLHKEGRAFRDGWGMPLFWWLFWGHLGLFIVYCRASILLFFASPVLIRGYFGTDRHILHEGSLEDVTDLVLKFRLLFLLCHCNYYNHPGLCSSEQTNNNSNFIPKISDQVGSIRSEYWRAFLSNTLMTATQLTPPLCLNPGTALLKIYPILPWLVVNFQWEVHFWGVDRLKRRKFRSVSSKQFSSYCKGIIVDLSQNLWFNISTKNGQLDKSNFGKRRRLNISWNRLLREATGSDKWLMSSCRSSMHYWTPTIGKYWWVYSSEKQ